MDSDQADLRPRHDAAGDCFDVILIGGGFYGCSIAAFLARHGYKCLIIEREAELMLRASLVNQARLHNGYHYPRSYRTALRSRVNLPVFREVFPEAVFDDFRALYAIARHGSMVSAAHFRRFCNIVGMEARPAGREHGRLFDNRLIEAVFEVVEPVFNWAALRDRLIHDLLDLQIETQMERTVVSVNVKSDPRIQIACESGEVFTANWVFNCTYADLGHVRLNDSLRGVPRAVDRFGLYHQIAEVALFEPPAPLRNLGVTIMDGPFLSTLPFPSRGLHSLTHVQYTHHYKWDEGQNTPWGAFDTPPTEVLDNYLESRGGRYRCSQFPFMIRDARRFLPILDGVPLVDTLFDVKTLLTRTSVDASRPILFHRHGDLPGFISVLGGKVDNIFDILCCVGEEMELPS